MKIFSFLIWLVQIEQFTTIFNILRLWPRTKSDVDQKIWKRASALHGVERQSSSTITNNITLRRGSR